MIPRFLSAGFARWFLLFGFRAEVEQKGRSFCFRPQNEQGDGNKRTVHIFGFLCDSIVINRLL